MTQQNLADKSAQAVQTEPERPYKLFNVTLARKTMLSPHMCRLTFRGATMHEMSVDAPDQRIKLFFPAPSGEPSALPDDGSWMKAYQALPDDRRPARRTYTIRALRPDELDIDFVLHGETGPASKWATRACEGDPLQIVAPNAKFGGDAGGYEWSPPKGIRRALLIGDETALPAIAGILETLVQQGERPLVSTYIEVPAQDDCIVLTAFPELTLKWMPRSAGVRPGDLMIEAAAQAILPERVPTAEAAVLPDINLDETIMWEKATTQASDIYVWVAGEAQAVKTMRRILIQERGLDRKATNLMGYWRDGHVLD